MESRLHGSSFELQYEEVNVPGRNVHKECRMLVAELIAPFRKVCLGCAKASESGRCDVLILLFQAAPT